LDIADVFVLGAGYMGNGIAQVTALAGYKVTMSDVGDERLQAGMEEIRWSLGKLLSKEKVTQEKHDAALENLHTTTDFEEASAADIVVEAVPENLELKKEVFGRLDGICPDHTILATNTSAIPISSIAAATKRPDKVVGTHFFGPVPLMRLCEIISGLLTSEETFTAADAWARSVGKETVLVRKDHAGFVANRINIPTSLEAVRMVEEGVVRPEEIDKATGGFDFGVGPMQIMDNAGVDVSLGAATAIYNDTGDPVFRPPSLMYRMVAAGILGRKSGKGFYDYSSGERVSYELVDVGTAYRSDETEEERVERLGKVINRLLLPNLLEAVRLLEAGVALPEDIDKASRLGFNFPQGPLEMADSAGIDTAMSKAEAIYEETGSPVFLVPPLMRRMVAAGLLGRKTNHGFYTY
jgi:3-hydroxybutyryl-CoA dehydrogenase